MEAYTLSVVGVLALCLLSILLAIHSGYSKGRAGALSGPVLPADDGNPLYRIDRVHMNSVEALAPFVVPGRAGDDGRCRADHAGGAGMGPCRDPPDSLGDLFARRQRGERRQCQNHSLCLRRVGHSDSCCRDGLGSHLLRHRRGSELPVAPLCRQNLILDFSSA